MYLYTIKILQNFDPVKFTGKAIPKKKTYTFISISEWFDDNITIFVLKTDSYVDR